jgi:hypothetical protein
MGLPDERVGLQTANGRRISDRPAFLMVSLERQSAKSFIGA